MDCPRHVGKRHKCVPPRKSCRSTAHRLCTATRKSRPCLCVAGISQYIGLIKPLFVRLLVFFSFSIYLSPFHSNQLLLFALCHRTSSHLPRPRRPLHPLSHTWIPFSKASLTINTSFPRHRRRTAAFALLFFPPSTGLPCCVFVYNPHRPASSKAGKYSPAFPLFFRLRAFAASLLHLLNSLLRVLGFSGLGH